MLTYVGYFVLLLGVASIASVVVSHLLSPLRSIPGPFLARFTRLWFLHRVWRGDIAKENIALHRKYGKIVRYGPSHYSFNDSEAIRVIYGKGNEFWDPDELFTKHTVNEVKSIQQRLRYVSRWIPRILV